MFLWSDTFHLRLGVGMAAAGAVYASVAALGRRREKNARRTELAEARKDSAAEMRFEIGRREGQISHLRMRVRESEETVLLFEQRAIAQQERADAEATLRIQAEYDLAALTAWVHQARAELTRSAVQSVQSLQAVQSFEPMVEITAGPQPYALPSHTQPSYAPPSSAPPSYTQPSYSPPASTPATYETVPEPRPVGATSQAPRPLRSAVIADRQDVGFDVASDVHSAPRDPYLVPGVTMPRARKELASASPTRPIAPERLYRPYLSSGSVGEISEQANRQAGGTVDLTLYDDTTQFTVVDRYKTGTG